MLKVNREGEDDHYEVDDDGNEDENHSGPGPDRSYALDGIPIPIPMMVRDIQFVTYLVSNN